MDLSGQLRPAFTAKVLDVLERAAVMRAPGRPMGTLDVFLALVEADAAADWQRIWLNFRELHEADAGRYRDPSPHDGDSWNSRPVTGTCARAIRAAVALADGSAPSLLPVSTGVLALCLVGRPVTAASSALGATAGPAHHLLLELAQEALVGSHWADIESVLQYCFDAPGPGAPGGLDLDDEDPGDEDPDVRRLMEDPDVRRLIEYRADMMEALFATIREFLRADTLGRSGALLEQHPELLGADANAIIETSIRKAEQIGDLARARHMRERQRFLESYRQLIGGSPPNAAPAERTGECARSDHVLTGSIVEEPGYTSVAVRCGRCHVGYLSDVRWEPGEAHVSYHVFPADGAMEISREILMWAVAACEESIAELEQMGGRVRKSKPVIGGRPESLRRHTDFKPI
jgi:hypothetical protein